MALIIYTAPTSEPVTLEQAKDHLRIIGTDEDSYITLLISAARGMAESLTKRALITQTWDWKLEAFPEYLDVPKAPLISVTSITYVDVDGNTQTLSSALYTVLDAASQTSPGRIVPAYGQSWPSVRGMPNDIIVRFVAGYGSAPSVPEEIRWAILLILAELFARRESTIVGTTINEVPYNARALLSSFILYGLQ